MSKRIHLAGVLLGFVLTQFAVAESLALFKASQGGEEAWVWGSARLKEAANGFTVREHNRHGDTGDVYVADRFPAFRHATVTLDVVEVPAGNYTLELLGYKNGTRTRSVFLVESSRAVGHQSFPLEDEAFAGNVDELELKMWVGGEEGACTVLRELTYSVSLDGREVFLDERFEDLGEWEADKVQARMTGNGMALSVDPGETFGSLLHERRIPWREDAVVLLHVGEVRDGDVSVQLVALDREGHYLESLDVLMNARAGGYGASLATLRWPEGTASVRPKLWLGGGTNATAVVGRLLLLER